jgi:hypothetical protein
MWEWNLVSHTEAKCVWEQGAEEDIWALERLGNRRLEKNAQYKPLWSVLVTYYVNQPNLIKGADSMYGGEERLILECGGETWWKET